MTWFEISVIVAAIALVVIAFQLAELASTLSSLRDDPSEAANHIVEQAFFVLDQRAKRRRRLDDPNLADPAAFEKQFGIDFEKEIVERLAVELRDGAYEVVEYMRQ